MASRKKPTAAATPAAAPASPDPRLALVDDLCAVVGAIIDCEHMDAKDLREAKQRIRLHRESLPDDPDQE